MKEVRNRTRQKYQLENLRDWRAMCERNGDMDDVEIIDRHIKLCTEDTTSDAELVGWIRCMENADERFLDSMKWLLSNIKERKRQAESFGWTDFAKQYDAEIEGYDYMMIEAGTALIEWKHSGLCAHAWDCDE